MSDIITANLGDCIFQSLLWQDEDGNPLDLTGYTVEITESCSAALSAAQVSIPDPSSGRVELFISSEISSALPLGLSSWFRIAIVNPGGCRDASPRIRINII